MGFNRWQWYYNKTQNTNIIALTQWKLEYTSVTCHNLTWQIAINWKNYKKVYKFMLQLIYSVWLDEALYILSIHHLKVLNTYKCAY
jgi:hypothetical protein